MVVEAANLGKKAGINLKLTNESGRVVYARYDDVMSEWSIDANFISGAVPTVGGYITYGGANHIVESTDLKYQNKDTQRLTLKTYSSEYLTIP